MSEQGAAPEIPESEFSVSELYVAALDRIAALTLERDTLKAERDEFEQKGQEFCSAYGLSLITIHDLKAKVERLSAPVSDEEWTNVVVVSPQHDHRTWMERKQVNSIIAARASAPPPHPINDDEQRRKDAAWNDRPKARCVCGEMIAWYSGEWLHVDSRSGLCADGRLASPAHFLVGRTPAEPEWTKEQRVGGPMAKIGELRRALFVSFDCKWNGLVRDVTAEYETHGEEVDVCVVLQRLINVIRENAQLDHSFPAASRLAEMFALSDFNDDYVAWMRWAGDTGRRHLTLCDSDSDGAFRVYRHPSSPIPDPTTAPLP